MKRNKYGVRLDAQGKAERTVDGHTFHSKAEAQRYRELQWLLKAGAIRDLERQPRFHFVINGVSLGFYRADFRYVDVRTGKTVVEDVKGHAPKEWTRTKKLMRALYGVDVQEIRARPARARNTNKIQTEAHSSAPPPRGQRLREPGETAVTR